MILEVLSGLRTTLSAAEALSVSLARYYALEARAVQGLVTALEPRPKGKQVSPTTQVARREQEIVRLTRELARTQSLVRVAQRTVGVAPAVEKPRAPGKRRRRAVARGAKAALVLRQSAEKGAGDGPGTAG